MKRQLTPVNPIPEKNSRWFAAPVKGSPENAPDRKIAVERVYFDEVRQDTRIEFVNLETGRHGAVWYETFKRKLEFWPDMRKGQPPAPQVDAAPAVEPAADLPALAPAIASPTMPAPAQPEQLPLTTTYRPADPRLLSIGDRIATALEAIARSLAVPQVITTTTSNGAAVSRATGDG